MQYKRVMIMFKKLGELITRRPLAVIAVWVLILILMAPLAIDLPNHLSYDGSSFMPKGTDSSIAQGIFDNQFPSTSKTQMAVVVESDNKTATAAFINRLNNTLENDTAMKNMTQTASIYGVQQQMLSNMTPGLHENLLEGQDNVSDVNHQLYNGIDSVENASDGLYWLWDNVTKTNSQLYQARKQIIDSSAQLYSGRDQLVQSHDGLYMISAGSPGMTEDQAVSAMMYAQNSTSPAMRAELTAIYELGPNPSSVAYDNMFLASVPADQQSAVRDIYNLGRNPSDGAIGNYLENQAVSTLKNSDTGKNMSAADLQNATDMIHDAWNIGPAATKQDFDNYVLNKAENGQNDTEKQSIQEIWDMGPGLNDTMAENYVLEQAAKNGSMNQSQLDDARDIVALGRNTSNDSIQAYIVNKTMTTLNMTGNGSYFLAVMNLDRNMSNDSLSEFGAEWATNHAYDNPDIIPHQLAKSMVSGNVSLYVVMFDADGVIDENLLDGDLAELRGKIAELKSEGSFDGVKAYVTGSVPIMADTKTASTADASNIDKFTIGIVIVLLLIYFRSVLTPFVPLTAIVIALIASMGAVTLVSHLTSIYYIVQMLMLVIMMGAGIDYCVFMLSRYSEERREGNDVKSAVVTTVQHAGKSIASSGLTAALGFAALVLTGQGIFISMGIAVAIGLTISMLTALTLIPALLTLLGDRIFWPTKHFNVKSSSTLTGLWSRLASGVIKHAKVITVLVILLAIPTVYVATQFTTGSDTIAILPHDVESKQGFDVLKNSMGSGVMSRTMITVTIPVNLTDASGNRSVAAMDRIENISAMIAGIKDVNTVYSMTRPDGTTINYSNLSEYNAIEKGYYENYMDNATGKDDRTTVIYASFNGSPDSNEAFAAIDQMKAVLQNNSCGALQGTEIHVGGDTAQNHELSSACINGFVVVLPVVIVGIMIILLVLLRSIVLPVRIILTLSMSVLMTLAAFVLVYQIGQNETMIYILPIIFFCALMGMGVDYDIFLVSRIEEEMLKGKSLKEGIIKAIASTGTIILVCALVMAGAFGSLIMSSMQIMSQIGFVLSLGILIQAILMMLVVAPAITSLLGKYNWWMPGKKNKVEALAVAVPRQEEKTEK